MATGYDAAVDSILSAVKTPWDLGSGAIVDSAEPVTLIYEETQRDGKPDPSASGLPYARVTIRHDEGYAAALGGKRYRREGTVWVQVFVPAKDGLSKTKATSLARIAQKAYEDARGVVCYKAVTVQEKGLDGSFYRVDCRAQFWWDEIK